MILTVTPNPAVDKTLEVPGFHVGAHARAELKALLPAGKGVNVARGLARLGIKAAATGFVGRTEEQWFVSSLATEGIQARFCIVSGQTRTNTTILDPSAHTTTHLREKGFAVTPDDVAKLCKLVAEWLSAPSPPDAVVIAGSLPAGMAPQDLAGLVKSCAKAGARVVLDTNGPALREAIQTRLVHTVKPNLEELSECLGRHVLVEEAPEAARELLDYVDTVLLTLGAMGAYVVRKDMAAGARCALGEGEVRSTVGCGDAFLAGWLKGTQTCRTPQEALRWAVAAGAACALSELTVGYSLSEVTHLAGRCQEL